MADAPGAAAPIGIRPAHLSIVDQAVAARVAAPAYDTLSPARRAHLAQADPLSFLNVLRSPEDRGGDLRDALRANATALRRLLDRGVFRPGAAPRFAWYRLAVGDHVQTALIAEVALADYDAGRIMRHEHTRAERESELAAYLRTVGVSSSPAAVAYPSDVALRRLAAAAAARPPVVAITTADGVEHTVWTTEADDEIAAVSAALRTVPRLYITDGHHRFAAASEVAAGGRAAGHGPDAADQWLLAALFPSDELRIMPFHRAVLRPRDRTVADLIDALGDQGTVRELGGPATPDAPHRYGVYLDAGWYELALPDGRGADGAGTDGPPPALAGLDVTVLQQRVLRPVFGVAEPRFDPRLRDIPGGPADVVAYCDDHGAVGFLLRAMTMEELMAVADADLVMPPKSTRFDPKVRSGIFLRQLR